jgi:hypothetical protein
LVLGLGGDIDLTGLGVVQIGDFLLGEGTVPNTDVVN